MRIHVTDRTLLPELAAYLRARGNAIVTEVSEDELEISLLGSYADGALRMELYLLVRAWEAARKGAEVEILD